ncbi:MAG: hypothetical protein K2Y22_09090 [Candidatus Obscuribacterales bacterium]|nr:hypothetical protein [Candidatus Obscuribacterales bacterium]
MTENETSAKSKITIRTSQLVWALGLFVVANIALLKWQPLSKVDPESLPAAHTWIWWAAKELAQQQQGPDIALMGSSFMMHPLALRDADYLKKDFDFVHHHYSSYLEDSLKQHLGVRKAQCFNFAMPGGMISDHYMITRTLLSGSKKPRVIVIGAGVRDFMDKHVSCAAATRPFKYLQRYTEIDDLVGIAMPQIWQQADYWQGRGIYLWGKKMDFQVVACDWARKVFNPLLDKYCVKSPLNDIDQTRNAPSNMRMEAEEGLYIVKADAPYKFDDNTREYMSRYGNGNDKLLENQKLWLDKLLQLARDQNIEVLLVSMPATPANMQLMPPGAYNKFITAMREASQKWNVQLVDLNGGTGFGDKFDKLDFSDTAHMNGRGGKKLIDAINVAICRDKRLANALNQDNNANIQLAGSNKTH